MLERTHAGERRHVNTFNIHPIDSACWFCSQLFSGCQPKQPELTSFITSVLIQWKCWQATKVAKNCDQRSQGGTLQPARPNTTVTDVVKHTDARNNEKFALELLYLLVVLRVFLLLLITSLQKLFNENPEKLDKFQLKVIGDRWKAVRGEIKAWSIWLNI